MKHTFLLIIFTFVVFAGANSTYSQTPKEITIAAARALETDPFGKETTKLREKAFKWVAETEEVSVTVCGGLFSMLSDKKNKNSSTLAVAYTLGMAAFKLENPTSDETSAQIAGFETALKSYESAIAAKPKTKNDAIDALIVKRNNNELKAMIEGTDCK